MNNNLKENKNVDAIEINQIFRLFLRNKNFIFVFTFLITFLTILYSYSLKTVWKGKFNVVVKSENNSLKLNQGNSALISALIGGDSNNKKTQELILQSPSVLMPVYEFVKENYERKNISTKKLDFETWRKRELDIKFEKNSNVLKIIHMNTDKELILNTLNLISEKYKDYSRKDRALTLNRTINYLKSQKNIMTKKSIISMKKLNKFSIENGLGNLDGFVSLGKSDNSLLSQLSDDSRIYSVLQNSGINLNQGQIEESDAGSNAGQRFQNQYNLLERYESRYTDLSAKLKPNSIYLNQLKLKIDNLRNALKRPNEILIKYKELSKLANRDERLLNDIENDLEIMKLEQIKIPNPWSMISQPTIDRIKVYPNKKNYAITAFLASAFLGTILSFIKEKYSGIIYDISVIKDEIDCKYLGLIYSKNRSLSEDLLDKILSSFNNNFLIINVKNKADNAFLNSLGTKNKFQISDFYNKDVIDKYENLFVVIEQENISKNDLLLINNYISIFKEKVRGWIFIDNKKNIF